MSEQIQTNLKFLCVGFMKTGLTSLHDTAESLGLSVRHRRYKIWKAFLRSDYQTVMDFYETADLFVDWPHPYMYRPFLEKYRDRARIILTVREPDSWYASLLRHNAHAHPITHSHKHIFGRFYPHGFKDEHLALYNAHNETVERYFSERGLNDQLLVLKTGDTDNFEKFKAFSGLEITDGGYAHSNISAERKHRDAVDVFRENYNKIVQPLYAKWAPKMLVRPGQYRTAIPASDWQPGSEF